MIGAKTFKQLPIKIIYLNRYLLSSLFEPKPLNKEKENERKEHFSYCS